MGGCEEEGRVLKLDGRSVGEEEGGHFAGAVQYCTPGEILKEQAMNDGTEV